MTNWDDILNNLDTVALYAEGAEAGQTPCVFDLGELDEVCPEHIREWLEGLPDNAYVKAVIWPDETLFSGYADDIRELLELPAALGASSNDEVAAILARADDQQTLDACVLERDHGQNFQGVHSSWQEFADSLAADFYPEHMEPVNSYVRFDFKQFASDLKLDYSVYDVPGGLAVYSNH